MASRVYLMNMRAGFGENSFAKFQKMMKKVGIDDVIRERDQAAIKLHFGEQGTFSYLHPVWIRETVKIIKKLRANPFLTDTSSLYTGGRSYAVSHIETALIHGFAYACVNAPIIISDGLKGTDGVKVEIHQNHFKTVSIASGIYHADSMVVLTHFKGHMLSGFGGALKNVGMGCADKAGKYKMHLGAIPLIKPELCKGCLLCLNSCPGRAISLIKKIPVIDHASCIGCGQCFSFCQNGVFKIDWDAVPPATIVERMVEFAYGALLNKQGRVCFVNFILNVTPGCDCLPFSDACIVPDVGIAASLDPVALDQACVDLVNGQQGIPNTAMNHGFEPHEDKFLTLYPQVNWQQQLEYAQQIGIGMRDYELITVGG
ncbi:hypothetical protein AUJ95_07450 [Candidatus Desantisbacteria bacterium CG2_30_40_21]|uniref:4Fe-4S ferredoxin n=3 Tax=unclassified Candidatus Desantisiibacteriota TaxID=3106372 RepID=A0A2M7J8W2_9BACT|nr:MAG: hypothetical protein AUJ95_07450 [Candidatus Desantisbacteria bacterium CG2_30_40_21]PIX15824.1 MAG: 4Fe-4S ferredoxin [Candidatus Desantisbacteria bacterium CG_4_8_14_3_um_filter_40_12]PIY19480.1 MAG: 4Fe-4S ferredoxin [Candidatus Desantisbacteria bacterium CG_4_10_14_3_um_filter_40_18]